MSRTSAILLLLCAPLAANAQSLSEYLRMRERHKVDHAADPVALDSLQGSRILELEGLIKGSFQVGGRTSLMFEREDGKPVTVNTVAVSSWLLGNELRVRLLVRATRETPTSALRVVMIGAAPDSDIDQVEAEVARIAAAKRAAAERRKKEQAARSAERPSTGSPLRGTITRGGTRLSSRGTTRRGPVAPTEAVGIYSQWIQKVNGRLSQSQATKIARAVIGFSAEYEVDPRLVMSILLVESNFNPGVVSRAGAMGLGQLMPSTAKWMGVSDPFDTNDNLYGSIKLLRYHLEKYNGQTGGKPLQTIILSLAAYNAGEGAVRRHGGVPPYRETQAYVKKVIAIYRQLCSNDR
jgi:soluble lytic murein transglycosylase-like protein